MSKETKIFIGIVIGLLVVIGALFVASAKTPGKYDELAQCITDSGAKFYGAFWCPHCQAQKALFGKSAKKLPYVECSNQDQTQTQVCIDAKIEGYPTWEFADKTRVSGEQTFADLAAKTNCAVPAN
jgi:thiol-disulfide isomerase/thioredoxin